MTTSATVHFCVGHASLLPSQRSQQWRLGSKYLLLLSTIQPQNEVTWSTLSGWVKLYLGIQGRTQVFLRLIPEDLHLHQKPNWRDAF